ncbi:MAG: hypothetical protein ABRQ39_15590 [Candidatus Eremiobacterota bacterium]
MVNIQMKNELISLIETLTENDIMTTKKFIEFLIAQEREKNEKPSQYDREDAADKLCGMFAHLPGGTEEFLKEKYEDIDREEQKFKERCR